MTTNSNHNVLPDALYPAIDKMMANRTSSAYFYLVIDRQWSDEAADYVMNVTAFSTKQEAEEAFFARWCAIEMIQVNVNSSAIKTSQFNGRQLLQLVPTVTPKQEGEQD